MSAALAPEAAERLTKVAGLLGSDHDGERAAAALLATRLLREHGLTWAELIEAAQRGLAAPSATRSPGASGASSGWGAAPGGGERDAVAWCWRQRDRLTAWETEFVASLMRWRGRFSPKQAAKLHAVVQRLRAERRAA